MKDMQEIDYMNLTEKLLDKIGVETGGNDDDKVVYSALQKLFPEIKEISSIVKGTGLYKDCEEDSENFYKDYIKLEPTKMEQVLKSYLHLLYTICNSPTRVHLRGTIILVMPILEKCLELPE